MYKISHLLQTWWSIFFYEVSGRHNGVSARTWPGLVDSRVAATGNGYLLSFWSFIKPLDDHQKKSPRLSEMGPMAQLVGPVIIVTYGHEFQELQPGLSISNSAFINKCTCHNGTSWMHAYVRAQRRTLHTSWGHVPRHTDCYPFYAFYVWSIQASRYHSIHAKSTHATKQARAQAEPISLVPLHVDSHPHKLHRSSHGHGVLILAGSSGGK